ncbi:MAG: M10 family metallopeptidase C-terminal domain-containing protein [Caulobacteraceae bacterium]|nr:M10 family metallopeptidase C-terminal domain-containing protein [Caulobacteraceae bacterium]
MAYATDYTTLLTGSYWSGAEIAAKLVFVTYSFDTTAPASDAGHLAPSALATFTAYTAAQQAQARQALAEWSSASTVAGGGSGIVFLEVPSGQGDINFASYDFTSDPNARYSGGEGYYPWGNWNYSTGQPGSIHFGADLPGAGNILMNTAFETGGLFSYATVLHEIGHALGLKHPTDAWTNDVPGYIDVVHNQWDPNITYDPNFSIMSAGATSLTDLTGADYQAIQSIYGTPSMAANADKSWSWDAGTNTLTQVLKGGGQTVRGVSTSNLITGGTGADAIYAIGAGTNTVWGRGGADTLVGGSGVSYLDGGAGADTINGWFGASWASYQDAAAGVVASLANPSLNTGDAAGDSYLHIGRLLGSKFAEGLTGDGAGDVIEGAGGADLLAGGAGNTIFVYAAIGDSAAAAPDTIADFHSGDLIDLSAIDANPKKAGFQSFSFGTQTGKAGDLVATYDAVHDRTVVDLYNKKAAAPQGTIWLAGNHALTAADFILTGGARAPAPAGFASAMASFGAGAAESLYAGAEPWSAPRFSLSAPRTQLV